MDTLIYHSSAIMARPAQLTTLTNQYFDSLAASEDEAPRPPTPAGLALGLGFSSVVAMVRAAEDPRHAQESREVLHKALTALEDHLSVCGLTERTHPAFTKYLMTARLGVVEPKVSPDEVQAININILGVGPQAISIGAKPLEELL